MEDPWLFSDSMMSNEAQATDILDQICQNDQSRLLEETAPPLCLTHAAARVCITWMQSYPGTFPETQHLDALSILTREKSSTLKQWFANRARAGASFSDDPGYKSQSTASMNSFATGWHPPSTRSSHLGQSTVQTGLGHESNSNLPFSRPDGAQPGIPSVNSVSISEDLDVRPSDAAHIPTSSVPEDIGIISGSRRRHLLSNANASARDRTKFLGRYCTKTSDPEKLRRNPSKPWQCTRGCGKTFSKKKNWIRHEEIRYPQKGWVCLIDHTVRMSGQRICSHCPRDQPVPDPTDEHFTACHSGIAKRCQLDRQNNRGGAFYRHQHFTQHFKKVHPGLSPTKFASESFFKVRDSAYQKACGFCGHAFCSWRDRIDHVSRHFESGEYDMQTWRDEPELPPEIGSCKDRQNRGDSDFDDDNSDSDDGSDDSDDVDYGEKPAMQTSKEGTNQTGVATRTAHFKSTQLFGLGGWCDDVPATQILPNTNQAILPAKNSSVACFTPNYTSSSSTNAQESYLKRKMNMEDYRVGMVRALAAGLAAGGAMLDVEHQAFLDSAVYRIGRIVKQSAFIYALRISQCETASAMTTSSEMISKFKSLSVGSVSSIKRPNWFSTSVINTRAHTKTLLGRSLSVDEVDDILEQPDTITCNPIFECSFDFLSCTCVFYDELEWREHCLAHFRLMEPPRSVQCPLCDRFRGVFKDGVTAWYARQTHMANEHHRKGDTLANARPDFKLMEHLWRKRLISDSQYQALRSTALETGALMTVIKDHSREQRKYRLSRNYWPPARSGNQDSMGFQLEYPYK
jgi:hypothetical protein